MAYAAYWFEELQPSLLQSIPAGFTSPAEESSNTATMHESEVSVVTEVATKPWMDYRTVTDTSSRQYQLIEESTHEENGTLTWNGYTLVAMGSQWGEVGSTFEAVIGGKVVYLVKADEKQDRHTLYGEGWFGMDGHVLEVVVDTDYLDEMALVMGDCDYLEALSGQVERITKL